MTPSFRFALHAAALLATQSACVPRTAAVSRGTPPPCLPSAESIVMVAARNAAADRLAENRYRLPWTDSTPPAPISDAGTCARAADAYARAAWSTPGGRAPVRAGVVRAGGLYFVVSPPGTVAGEFTGVGVLDGEFRWLVGLAM